MNTTEQQVQTNKYNYKYLLLGSVFLILFNFVKYGISTRSITQLVCTLIGGFIIPSVVYFSKSKLTTKVCIMNWSLCFSSLIYGILVNGSSSAIFALFIFLIVSSMYYERKYIYLISIPVLLFSFIFWILALICILMLDYSITVTDRRVIGKIGRKSLDLPIDSVSAVGIGRGKSIIVSTFKVGTCSIF